ncbi:leucine-rich repeat domain-containing protein [uncultured Microscilla sp.]|uniref:leucine-rich repeat domain-containing protein n=1 Tax=uncultured Microscilla sp. TaxID=432653 RepID=UPI00262F652B|nr:leucine-rich repeat domain-containing protein [uncultured Microscilla sp.]
MTNQEITNVHQLITSTNPTNLQAAFAKLQAAPHSTEALTYLFILSFFHPDEAVRTQAKPLFKARAPIGFYANATKELLFAKIVPKSGIPSVFVFTALLEKMHQHGVLDVKVLGVHLIDFWVQSWEFCWKHRAVDAMKLLRRVQKGKSLQLAGSIKAIPEEIWQLTELESLTIINRNLGYISEDIAQLKNLKYLNIQSKLAMFPVGITQLHQLAELKLFINNDQFFGTVPPEVAQLAQLKELTFTSLSGSFPVNFCRITSLERIDLGYSNFEDFPEEVTQLNHLNALKLNFNENLQLSGLFSKLHKISSLKNLDLSFCKLNTLPDEVALLDQVEKLNIAGCHLRSLPTHIEDMVSLKYLDISHNHFEQLPQIVHKLPRLEQVKTNQGVIDIQQG